MKWFVFLFSFYYNFCNRCVSYGVLTHEEAERLYENMVDRKKSNRLSGGVPASPVKSSNSKKSSKPNKVKKARILKEEDFDPDMQVSSGDGIGRTSL